MIRSEPSHPSRAAIRLGAAVVALLLAGCSAGQLTATSTLRSSAGGASGGSGAIVVRDAEIKFGTSAPATVVYPAGANAPLQMHIVNDGAAADKLVSASSPWASAVQVSGQTELPGGGVIVVNGGSSLLPGSRSAQIALTGLRGEIRAGLTYPVELVFQHAGHVHLDLPVANPNTPREPAAE